MTELIWDGKYDRVGHKVAPLRVPLPFQTVETVSESAEHAPDVAAFAKLSEQFGFAIEYVDAVGNLRYYEPDFVARLADGTHYLAETKGRKDVDAARKDRAAQIWCETPRCSQAPTGAT